MINLLQKKPSATYVHGIAKPGDTEVAIAKLYLRIMPKARFRIYRMLGRMLAANIDARTSLEYVHDVLSNGGAKPGEFDAVAVASWFHSFKEHGRISEAVTGWVPTTEVLLLEAGERSGRFQHALDVMLNLNDKMSTIRGMLLSKLARPVLSAAMLGGILYYMATDIIPPMIEMRGGTNLFTGSARTVAVMMEWIANWLILSTAICVLTIVVIVGTLSIFRGSLRDFLDRFQPWATHRFISGVTFFSGLIVLIESGRGLYDSLHLVSPNASPYLSDKISRIEAEMREGRGFGDALAAGSDQFPDIEIIKEIQVYEKTGQLDDGLRKVVEQWIDTATEKTGTQVAAAGGLIMGLSFGVVGLVLNGLYAMIGQLR